jgi:hypothetical protein
MRIGQIEFVDGDLVQGWNPEMMSRKVRKQVAKCLVEIAEKMLEDEFEDGGKFVKFPRPRARRNAH